MTIAIESVVLCFVFTLMVYFMSREPIKSLYNYPRYNPFQQLKYV